MVDLARLHAHALRLIHSGAEIHRAGLEAATHGDWERAEHLFGAAVASYRRDLDIRGLARLRIHELMAGVWSGADPVHETEHVIEIERRLCEIEHIQSITAPFALVEARLLIGTWRRAAGSAGPKITDWTEPTSEVPLARAA
jgi:hypothetical protein